MAASGVRLVLRHEAHVVGIGLEVAKVITKTKHIMKKLFKRFNQEAYTRNQTKRFGKVTFVMGIAFTIAIYQVVLPEVVSAYTQFNQWVNPPLEWQREVVEDTQPQEKIDVYYEEELNTLRPKFDDALHNKARSNAIERVQQDLEAEKESLREAELLL